MLRSQPKWEDTRQGQYFVFLGPLGHYINTWKDLKLYLLTTFNILSREMPKYAISIDERSKSPLTPYIGP